MFSEVETVNFHRNNFKNPPFLSVNQKLDTLEQVVPDGVLQVQPRLGSLSLLSSFASLPDQTQKPLCEIGLRNPRSAHFEPAQKWSPGQS